MSEHAFATANTYRPSDVGLDSHLLKVARQSELSRKLWLYFAMVTIAGVGVFIAMQ